MSDDDRTAKARIRDAALRLLGEKGFDATSLREVAVAAGVSHGLLRHHYGSKGDLRDAVESHVLAQLAGAFGGAAGVRPSTAMSTEELLAERARRFEAFQLLNVDVLDYVARILVDRSETGAAFFDRMVGLAEAEMAALEEAGHVRPAGDGRVRALLMMCLALGPVVLRPLVESALGQSLRSEDGLRRWFAGEVDLLQHGVYGAD